jgi:hypothetical protein
MDFSLAVAALLDTLRCVAALTGQLATGIGGGVVPPLVPFVPDARVSRRAMSAPRAAASCPLAHHTDVRGGSRPSKQVRCGYVVGRAVLYPLITLILWIK